MDGIVERVRRLRRSEKRLERLSRICPEQRPEETAEQTDRRLFGQVRLILALGSLLPASIWIKGGDTKTAAAALLLLLLVAAAPVLRNDSREKETAERVRRAALLNYPEFARELAVLFAAGYSIRGAWHHLAVRYQEERRRGGLRTAFGEELVLADRRMLEGDPEREALLGFSDRLGIIRYMRLCGLLIAAARGGRDDLCEVLRMEAEEAEHARLEEAKKQGETLTTRLLLPMILLFAMILAILVLPAFLSW